MITCSSSMNRLWVIWAKALGTKASEDDKVADVVAIVRTIIFLFYAVTNIVIIAGVIRHW